MSNPSKTMVNGQVDFGVLFLSHLPSNKRTTSNLLLHVAILSCGSQYVLKPLSDRCLTVVSSQVDSRREMLSRETAPRICLARPRFPATPQPRRLRCQRLAMKISLNATSQVLDRDSVRRYSKQTFSLELSKVAQSLTLTELTAHSPYISKRILCLSYPTLPKHSSHALTRRIQLRHVMV